MPIRTASRAILFDLDGTLTDPKLGITRSLSHALSLAGAGDDHQGLERFIGPPLRASLAELIPGAGAGQIEEALGFYRERFARVGIFENDIYPGIPEMLDTLRSSGARLFIATSKPRVFAVQVIDYFELRDYFDGIYGAELDGRFDDKRELLRELLAREELLPETTAMVGDRNVDIIAARINRMRGIGVTYGYGSAEELRDAEADAIVNSPEEIVGYFLHGVIPHAGAITPLRGLGQRKKS